MAEVSLRIIQALRNTARRIAANPDYQWGHMGSCNCGFLAQEVAGIDRKEIHARAMQRPGNWTEQLNDYCPTSGILMDDLITELLSFGFSRADLQHLETLSDTQVLRSLPVEDRHFRQNNKVDSARYLLAWARLLENKWMKTIKLDPGILRITAKAVI